MLSKSAARTFFLSGTVLCFGAFILLSLDTFRRIPGQTNEENMTEDVIAGKHLWDRNNCMGCHTLLGEGAYYAPELTKVFERRGESFIKAMLTDPQAMYPGERKMVKYDFTEDEKNQLVAFFKWIGEIDLNGFPAKPDLAQVAVPAGVSGSSVGIQKNRPMVFNQMCLACHSLGGQGGNIGPALDTIGKKMNREEIEKWLKDPLAVKPGTTMPKLPLSNADVKELAAFLTNLN